jgi:type VI secretion system secreted protein VgrG
MADGTNDSGLNGRVLTTGEIALARSIFGDSIDYTEVRIFEGLTSDGAAASAIGSNIFFPTETFLNDYSDLSDALRGEAGVFLHEMTHVWQDQNGVDITASQIEAVEQVGGDYTAIYDYRLEQGKEFSDYNIEQ